MDNKTAIQQLIEKLKAEKSKYKYGSISSIILHDAIILAQESLPIEKRQICDAYDNGKVDESIMVDEREPNFQNAEHYYIETYNSK